MISKSEGLQDLAKKFPSRLTQNLDVNSTENVKVKEKNQKTRGERERGRERERESGKKRY